MIHGRRVITLVSILAFGMDALLVSARSQQQIAPSPVVTLLPDGLRLDWQIAEPLIRINQHGFSEINIEGFDLTNLPGSVIVPFKSILIALPRYGSPTIEIEEEQVDTIEIAAPLARATPLIGVIGPESRYASSEAPMLSSGGWLVPPDKPILLEVIGIVRGVRLARLTFAPVLPEGQRLNITRQLKAIVHFNQEAASLGGYRLSNDPLLTTLDHLVVNSTQIEPIDKGISPSGFALPDKDVVALEISQTGITSISSDALKASGYPLEKIDPRYLRLFHSGQEVAYQWQGDQDAHFEPGERLLFFAEPRFSRWAKYDVYYLWADDQSGVRMGSRSAETLNLDPGAATITVLFEQNRLYTPDCFCAPIPAGRDGDRWVWDRIQLPDFPTRSYPFQLRTVDVSKPASLKIWLIGYTDLVVVPDHKIRISLNETELGVVEWDGKNAFSDEYIIPAGILINGENRLELDMLDIPGVPVDGVWLDAFEIRHILAQDISAGENLLLVGEATPHAYSLSLDSTVDVQVYEVTEARHPVILTNLEYPGIGRVAFGDPPEGGQRRYWLTTDAAVQTPNRVRLVVPLPDVGDASGGDYLIISPADFIPALEDLIALRTSQGMKVAVRDLLSIYDYFGWGIPDPVAIRNFIEFAYTSWERRPVYVLLVGDGTADPKQYLPSSSKTFLPPYLVEVDPWAGETAADNRYVTVDGNDVLPDMLAGRLPANSLEETREMVAKIVDYETRKENGEWIKTALVVADNPDSAGRFPDLSEEVLAVIPSPPFLAEKHYFDPDVQSPQEFRGELIEAWNNGSGLIMYTGHSSIHQWAGENIFHLQDIPNLANGRKLPVLLEMTCFTGSFHVPGFPTLDESLIRAESGGVIAAWGSSGLGIATGHRWLAKGFMMSVYNQRNVNLGSATLAGRLNVAVAGFYLDLIDTFNLFGDPATNLVRAYYLFAPFSRN